VNLQISDWLFNRYPDQLTHLVSPQQLDDHRGSFDVLWIGTPHFELLLPSNSELPELSLNLDHAAKKRKFLALLLAHGLFSFNFSV
jgi:hypothetical protein